MSDLECDCPACDNPKHHDMNVCMVCYHNECRNPHTYEIEPKCEDW